MAIERGQILEALRSALEPDARILAMWEGGSAARGRVDRWSDIDVQLVVEDGFVEQAFALAERALEALSPIELRWVVPGTPWHGHAQRFYRLRDAGPFLLVDLVVMKRSNPARFTEPEQHGQILVSFDKARLLEPPPFHAGDLRARMRAELEGLRARFPLFQSFVQKELLRGNAVDAMSFYLSLTLRPLVTILGMRYRPLRHGFGLRYLRQDLPEPLYREIEELCFVRDAADLRAKQERARALFERTLAELDLDAIPLEQLAAGERDAAKDRA